MASFCPLALLNVILFSSICETTELMTSAHGKDRYLHATLHNPNYRMLRYTCQYSKSASKSFAKVSITCCHVCDDPFSIKISISAYTGKSTDAYSTYSLVLLSMVPFKAAILVSMVTVIAGEVLNNGCTYGTKNTLMARKYQY